MVFVKFLLIADLRADGCPSVVEGARSDNGIEFLHAEFVVLLNSHGIRRENMPAASLQDDDVA